MKQSCYGSMSDPCESRVKPCSLDRESIISKLYIDLCNLIVESRIPGVNDRGYGEGIHCPPLMGPNTHCCDLSIPQCQKHQKLIHRLLRSMKRNIFEIEVFTLPDCCEETKFAERILKKEYVLLERWTFTCFHGSKIQSSIDVPQLLRAVRSFLYFSQISAWFSATNGKSPSSIYYWVRPTSEVSSAKFESEPELHTFPLCKLYEGLYGTVEVKYRTRTQYVPIIPCSKHPPQENPIITVIDDSNLCQTICLGTHIVKQLHKTCDTNHEIPISEITSAEPLSNVLSSSILPPTPKTICRDKSDTVMKSKGVLKHSNCQAFTDNVCGLLKKLTQDVDKGKNIRMEIKHLSINNGDDAYIQNSSQTNISLSKCNTNAPVKEQSKQQTLKRKTLDSSSTNKTLVSLSPSYLSPKKLKQKGQSYSFIKTTKLSLISSSNSGVIELSSHKETEDITNAHDDRTLVPHEFSKPQICVVPPLSKHHNVSIKSPQAVNLKRKDLTVSSENEGNFSQHHLALLLENKLTNCLPVSSKIVVSNYEPLLLEENSVPKKLKTSQQGVRRKSSKNKSKLVCTNKRLKNAIDDNSIDLVKNNSSEAESKSSSSCSTKTNIGVMCHNLNSIFIKEHHMVGRKRKLSKVSKLPREKEISDDTSKVTKKRLKYGKEAKSTVLLHSPNKLFSLQHDEVPTNAHFINSQVSCSESLTSYTVPHSKVRIFEKQKTDEKVSQNYHVSKYVVANKSAVQRTQKSKTIALPSRAFGSYSKKKSFKKRQRLDISSCEEIPTSQSHYQHSKQSCKGSFNQSFEICCKRKEGNESKNLLSYDKFEQNTSQKLVSDRNIVHISLPCHSEIKNTKIDKCNATLCTKCDFSPKNLLQRLETSTMGIQENYVYPSASTKHICDFTPKQNELCMPLRSSSLFSEQSTKSIAFFKKQSGNNKRFLDHSLKFKKGKRLCLNFEESIINGCFEPVRRIDGFKVEIGASGSFCPDHLKLAADVSFYELGSPNQSAAPYMAHVKLGPTEYYIPKKGAMQVTLFNPSETVVKMFVLNYDLSNMPPMCHTFIRQKSYYMPVGARERDPSAPKWLRYIIHIRFGSTKTGRIYLYEDLKIVILNKSNDDAASDHIQEPRELRSFLSVPEFSSL